MPMADQPTPQPMSAMRADEYLWFQVSEHTFDTFMMNQQRNKQL